MSKNLPSDDDIGTSRSIGQDERRSPPNFQSASQGNVVPEENKESREAESLTSLGQGHTPRKPREYTPNAKSEQQTGTLRIPPEQTSQSEARLSPIQTPAKSIVSEKVRYRSLSPSKFSSEMHINSQLVQSINIWGRAPNRSEIEALVKRCVNQESMAKGNEELGKDLVEEFQKIIMEPDTEGLEDQSIIASKTKTGRKKNVLSIVRSVVAEKLSSQSNYQSDKALIATLVEEISKEIELKSKEAQKKFEEAVKSNDPELVLEILRHKISLMEEEKYKILQSYYEVLDEKNDHRNEISRLKKINSEFSKKDTIPRELFEELQIKHSSKEEDFKDLSERFNLLNEKCTEIQSENQRLRRDLEKKRQDIDKYNLEMQDYFKKFSTLNQTNELLSSELTSLKLQLSGDTSWKMTSEKDEIAKKDSKIDELHRKEQHYQSRSQYLKFHLEIDCDPACKDVDFKGQVQRILDFFGDREESISKYDELSESMKKLEKTLADKTKEIDRLNKDKVRLDKEKKNEIDKLNQEIASLKDDHQRELEVLEEDIQKLKNDVEQNKKLEEKIKALKNDKEKLNQNLKRKDEDHKAVTEQLEQDIIEVNTQCEELEHEISELKRDKANLERQLQNTKQKQGSKDSDSQISTLKRRLEDAEAERDQQITRNTELEELYGTTRKDLQTAQDQLRDLKKQLNSKNLELQGLKNEKNSLEDKVKELEDIRQELQERLANSANNKNEGQPESSQVTGLNAKIDRLTKRNKELEEKYAQLQSQHLEASLAENPASEEIEKLETEIRDLRQNRETLEEKCKTANKQNAALNSKVEQLTSRIKELEAALPISEEQKDVQIESIQEGPKGKELPVQENQGSEARVEEEYEEMGTNPPKDGDKQNDSSQESGDLTKKIYDLQRGLEQAEAKVSSLEAIKSDLESQVSALEDEKASLEAQLKRAKTSEKNVSSVYPGRTNEESSENTQSSLQNEIIDLRTKLQTAEETTDNQNREIKSLRGKIDTLEKEKKTRQQENKDLQSKIDTTQKDLEDHVSEIQDLKDRIANLENEKSALQRSGQKEVRDLQSKLTISQRKAEDQSTEIQTLKSKIESLEADRDSKQAGYQDEIGNLQFKLTTAQRKIDSQSSEVLNLKRKLNDVEKDQASLPQPDNKDELSDLQSKLSTAESKILAQESEIRDLKKMLEKMSKDSNNSQQVNSQDETMELQFKLSTAESQIILKESEMQRLNKKFEKSEKDSQAKLSASQKKAEDQNTEILDLKNRIENLEADQTSAEAKYQDELRSLQSKLSSAQSKNTTKDSEIQNLKSRIDKLEKDLATAQQLANQDDLQSRLSAAETQISDQESVIQSLKRKLEKSEKESQAKLSDSQTKVENQRSEVQSLNDKIKSLETNQASTQASLQDELKTLQSKFSSAQNKIATKDTDIKGLKSRIGNLEKNLASAQSESQEELKELRYQLSTAQAKIDDQDSEIQRLRKKLEKGQTSSQQPGSQDEVRELKSQLLAAQRKIDEQDYEIQNLRRKLNGSENEEGSLQLKPEEGGKASQSQLSATEKKITEQQEEIASLKIKIESIAELQTKLSEAERKVDTMNDEIKYLNTNMESLDGEKESLQKSNDELKKANSELFIKYEKLQKIEEENLKALKESKDNQKLQEELANLRDQIAKLLSELSEKSALIEALRFKSGPNQGGLYEMPYEVHQAQIDKLNATISDLMDQRKKLSEQVKELGDMVHRFKVENSELRNLKQPIIQTVVKEVVNPANETNEVIAALRIEIATLKNEIREYKAQMIKLEESKSEEITALENRLEKERLKSSKQSSEKPGDQNIELLSLKNRISSQEREIREKEHRIGTLESTIRKLDTEIKYAKDNEPAAVGSIEESKVPQDSEKYDKSLHKKIQIYERHLEESIQKLQAAYEILLATHKQLEGINEVLIEKNISISIVREVITLIASEKSQSQTSSDLRKLLENMDKSEDRNKNLKEQVESLSKVRGNVLPNRSDEKPADFYPDTSSDEFNMKPLIERLGRMVADLKNIRENLLTSDNEKLEDTEPNQSLGKGTDLIGSYFKKRLAELPQSESQVNKPQESNLDVSMSSGSPDDYDQMCKEAMQKVDQKASKGLKSQETEPQNIQMKKDVFSNYTTPLRQADSNFKKSELSATISNTNRGGNYADFLLSSQIEQPLDELDKNALINLLTTRWPPCC